MTRGKEEGKGGKEMRKGRRERTRKGNVREKKEKREENTKLSVGAAIPPAIGAAISSEHWVLRTELERH